MKSKRYVLFVNEIPYPVFRIQCKKESYEYLDTKNKTNIYQNFRFRQILAFFSAKGVLICVEVCYRCSKLLYRTVWARGGSVSQFLTMPPSKPNLTQDERDLMLQYLMDRGANVVAEDGSVTRTLPKGTIPAAADKFNVHRSNVSSRFRRLVFRTFFLRPNTSLFVCLFVFEFEMEVLFVSFVPE